MRNLGWVGAGVAVTLGLAFVLPASAAMYTQILVDPPTPVVGEAARVSVGTFGMIVKPTNSPYLGAPICWGDSRARPTPVARWYSGGSEPDSLDLRVLARGPSTEQLEIRLVQRPGDGAYWDGSATFPAAGEWTLRVATMQDGRLVAISGPNDEAGRCGGFLRTIRVVADKADVNVAASAVDHPPPTTGVRVGVLTGLAILLVAAVFALLRLRPPLWSSTLDQLHSRR